MKPTAFRLPLGLGGLELFGFGHHPAYAADVFDVLFADFFAQAVDKEVYGVAFYFFAPAVDFVFQLAAGMDDACAANQGLQHGKFFLAQWDVFRLPCKRDLVVLWVELDVAVA